MRQLRNTPIPLARTRLALYSATFSLSLISGFFYIIALIHQNRIPSTNRYGYYDDFGYESLMAVTLLPISWSVVWSFIVIRTLLIAIKHNAPVTDMPNPNLSANESGPENSDAASSSHSALPTRPSRHQARRCCCCTCTPWFPKESGPHPVFVLCIEIFLSPSLATFGSIFGIIFTAFFSSFYYSRDCPEYVQGSRTELTYYCTGAYSALVALVGLAAAALMVSCVLHIVALVIACVLVHRWRGEMGLRRSQRAKRLDRTSAVREGDVEAPVWVEMGKRSGDSGADKAQD